MSDREWCDRCAWRTPHEAGVCLDCREDAPAPAEEPRSEAGTIDMFGAEPSAEAA